ncbi:MAG: DUF4838 domain-containing protein [Armatimonadetes bacterium]|nr:DUF4838 domain-containing protein [Armatimonadota bacterium]
MVRLLVALPALLGLTGLVVPQPLPLVADGRSSYAIYREAAAPPSVKLAAEELQRCLKASTGVELPIVEQPVRPMIFVGANDSVKPCPLTDGLVDDAFRLLTRDGDLFIVGKDLPDDRPPQRGWTSFGTLYGVYDFLERVVGVRWLLPGEIGEEIPHHDTLVVPELDLTQKPDLPIRYLVDIQDRFPPGDPRPNPVQQWELRQKLPTPTAGRKLDHGHAWDQYLTPEDWQAHPEWMAMDDQGRRRDFTARPPGVKYCTTNPELVQAFAAGVIKWLGAHPTWHSASISPADGGDFCRCPACQALVTTDPWGNASYTNNILKLYNDVAKIVGQEYPDRPLPGYVYYNYMYPPADPPKMEPNVWLVMAPLNYYGYGLYKPVYREEFPRVIEGWLKVTPNFVYHNYSNWMRAFNGTPLPCALETIKLEVPTLHRLGAQGVDMVGLGAWGYGGPTNYLLAKQMWDAGTDVDRTYEEWLRLAYGPAYPPMRELLDLVGARFKANKAAESPKYRGEMYEMNYAKAEDIYLPVLPEIERLYVQALGLAQTDKQRARLQAFGDNLVMMHWSLRKAGMNVPDAEKSVFYRSDEAYQQFLTDTETSIWLYRDSGKRYVDPIWRGEWSG